MEILKQTEKTPVQAVILDFDGTISTLRHGWEDVMMPMMLEMIGGKDGADDALKREVAAYIDESTGIQTIHQMKWLAEAVRRSGKSPELPDDPWWYKGEYNRRLMLRLQDRKEEVRTGKKLPDDYLMAGSVEFLKALRERGVRIYVASGTDDADVAAEAEILGVKQYFTALKGAMPMSEQCSKEATLRMLVQESGLSGAQMAVFGDGKVEIALGAALGAKTVGVASDEDVRQGINPTKRKRLVAAGADVIVGDFLEKDALLSLLGLEA